VDPLVYFIADLYPWWGLPLAFIFFEIANRHRRRGNRKKMLIHVMFSGFFLLLAGLYFFFNGFEHLRPAMEHLERTMQQK
jgi:hypothetical protein